MRGIILSLIILLLSIGSAWAADSVPVSPGGDGAAIGQTCPTFSWSAVSGAASYKIEVFEQQSTQIMNYDDMQKIAAPVLSYDVGAPALSWTPSSGSCLKTGSSYVWYVGTADSAGTTGWSSGKAFMIESSVLSVEQKDAVNEAVKEYLSKETIKSVASVPAIANSGAAVVTTAPDFSGSLAGGFAGGGEKQPKIASISNAGIEMPYSFGSTQLSIGDGNYSTYTDGTNISIGHGAATSAIYIGQDINYKGFFLWNYNPTPSSAYFGIGTYSGNNPLVLQQAGGNVGVGTIPAEKLDVAGNAKATRFIGSGAIAGIYNFSGGVASIAGGATAFVFAGPTASVTLAAGQTISGSATAALGLSSGGPQTASISLCYQLGSGTISTFGAGVFMATSVTTTRQIQSASASVSGLAAGTYNVGMCVNNYNAAAISNNDWVTGWVMVTY